jgi:lipid-binding SYLF domain-containing protein
MDSFYGKHVSTRAVLKGQVTIPAAAENFLNAVRGAKAQAAAQAGQ